MCGVEMLTWGVGALMCGVGTETCGVLISIAPAAVESAETAAKHPPAVVSHRTNRQDMIASSDAATLRSIRDGLQYDCVTMLNDR